MTSSGPALPRGAWLEIDLDALSGNLRAIKRLVGDRVEVAPVVKADAYGHGLEEASRAFVAAGADRLCVATVDEGLRLREAGVGAPIVVLFTPPADVIEQAVAGGLELIVGDEAAAHRIVERWAGESRKGAAVMTLHLEIETGLGRSGVRPERAAAVARALAETPGVRLAGVWSHLASPEQADQTSAQVQAFEAAVEQLGAAGVSVPVRHIAASGAIFAGTAPAYEMVRPGLAAYGLLPPEVVVADHAREAAAALRPAMTLRARPLRVHELPAGHGAGYGSRWRAKRPTPVATLPLGYGDGYAKAYWPGGEALVRGRRVPLVGVVMMDCVVVDVSDVPGVTIDDEFVLLGQQDDERITVDELARRRNTISWEVLTSMAQRLPRVYHAAAVLVAARTLLAEVHPDGTSI